jgi:hypothetical protein
MVSLPYKLLQTHIPHVQIVYRMWWNWQGTDPSPTVVAYMNKYYPPDWTYGNFGPQFRAELYGEYQ